MQKEYTKRKQRTQVFFLEKIILLAAVYAVEIKAIQ